MTEHEIQNQIRVALSEYGLVFRMNAGQFWQGKRRYSSEFRSYVLTDLYAVEGLPAGFPDLQFFGFDGRTAFIEVKSAKGKKREAQEKFINLLRSYGYRAGFARSVEETLEIVKGVK